MTVANFRTFQHYKSHKIMTYSSIIHGLLTCIQVTTATIHIKLSAPITDAKTMLSSQLYINYITKSY